MSTESHKSCWHKKEESLSMSHEGARRAVGRTPGTRGPASTSQVPTRARRSTVQPTKTTDEPGLFRLRGTFKRHVHPCCRPRAQPGHDPEPRVASGIMSLGPLERRSAGQQRAGAPTPDRCRPVPPGRRWEEAPWPRRGPPPPRKRASTRRAP